MNSALDIANFVINNSIYMTNLRLQKTLYYLYILFYRRFQKELFIEDFIALDYGPIIRNVYNYYKVFGNSQLYNNIIPNINLNKDEKDFLKIMIQRLGEYDVWDLVESTHKYDTWLNTPKNQVISKKLIKDYHNKNGIKIYRG